MTLPRAISAILLCLVALAWVPARAQPQPVVINRVALAPAQVDALSARIGARVQPGRYWYDHRSGAWGVEGGPAQGLLPAGLPVPGRLWLEASGGQTQVVVNGRALHPVDITRLRAAGVPVQRGRFWLDASGIGGVEGGPPSFNLRAMMGGGGSGGRKGPFSTYDLTGTAVY